MNTLKEKVAAAVSSITSRKVLIVDDEQPYVDVPTREDWIELKDTLQQAPFVYQAFLQQCEKGGRSIDEPPTLEMVQAAILQSKYVGTGLSEAITRYSQSKHVLAQIRDLLTDLGFSVSIYSHTPELDSSAPPFLVLVDFHFEGEEHEGQNAERTIAALMRPAFRVPPFVLLMSKRLDRSDCERWTRIAARSGYFRFNYDFLPKHGVQQNAACLYFAILNFVQHSVVSETYFQQMRTLEAEAKRIAETVTKEIFQITPPEAQIFAGRMRMEGAPLAQVFTDLFLQHLSNDIANSAPVRAAMKTFEGAISTEGLPTAEIQEHGNLHRLYSELLHPCVADPETPPSFGDIYERDDGKLHLVLSQECDIACGEGRPSKSDRILTIEGTLENRAAGSLDGAVISKPFWQPGRECCWLWWNLKKPAILQFLSIVPYQVTSLDCFEGDLPKFCRRWKLRFTEAEEIQNAFAFNLARVATDVLPSPVTRFQCECACELVDSCTLSEPLWFYMLETEGQRYISIAPESKVASLGSVENPFLTPDLALQLSRFVAINQFKELLKANKLMPVAEGSKLKVLLKFRERPPRGVSEWSGK